MYSTSNIEYLKRNQYRWTVFASDYIYITIDTNNTKLHNNYTIKQLNTSCCLSNRRLSKLIINNIYLIFNEINDLITQRKQLADMSIHSILHLLHDFVNRKNNNILENKYTFNEIYNCLCKFNILYTHKFAYKLCMLLYTFESLYSLDNETVKYIYTTNKYFQNIFRSFENSSVIFLLVYKIYIPPQFITKYVKLLKQHNIQNPILYIFNNYNIDETLINYKIISNIKKYISNQLYYHIILLISFYFFDMSSQYNFITNKLKNIIFERIKLNNKFEEYFFSISYINDFLLYIISNNINLSKQLLTYLVEFGITDRENKIKLCMNNNSTIL